MTTVAGKSRVNRPYFFTDTDGARVEVPAFDSGQGDLEGAQLAEFRMYERVGQIESVDPEFPPASTESPSITGDATVGETLTGSDGAWRGTPSPTLTRQWQADGADIAGATGATYVLTEGDVGAVISLSVTATNKAGESTAVSDPVGPVEPIEEPEEPVEP